MFNQCILRCLDGISVHSLCNNVNTNVKTVCGVLTANSDSKTPNYTLSRCSFTVAADNYHTKTKNSNDMPNSCFTMYMFHTDVLTYLPIQQPQASAYLHTAKIKTFRFVTLNHAARCLGKPHKSRNFPHPLLCSHNSHTNHCSKQDESNPPHLSTLHLKDPFQFYTLSYVQFFQIFPVPSGILRKTLPSSSHTHRKKTTC